MRDLDGRTLRTRIKGRDVLLRRLRALVIAASRFGRLRATSQAEQQFARVLTDGLTATLHAIDDPPQGGR